MKELRGLDQPAVSYEKKPCKTFIYRDKKLRRFFLEFLIKERACNTLSKWLFVNHHLLMAHCLILSNRCHAIRIVGIRVAKRTCGTRPENFDMTQTEVRGNRKTGKKTQNDRICIPKKRLLAHYEDECKKKRLNNKSLCPYIKIPLRYFHLSYFYHWYNPE